MAENDEFGFDDLQVVEPQDAKKEKKVKAEKSAKAEAKVEIAVTAAEEEPVETDPNKDRANWPVIHIDRVQGLPNYEYIGVHGTYLDGTPMNLELQIMRGVDVAVPPAVVHALRNTIQTAYEQRHDPVANRNILEPIQRSAVPWRVVKHGKYIQ